MIKKMLVGVAVLALIGAGVASAAIPNSSTGVITGCYTGYGFRVIDKQAGAVCLYGETELSWNQTGPVGPAGATGATGPQGPAGATGATGAGGVSGFEYKSAQASQHAMYTTLIVDVLCPTGKKALGEFGSARFSFYPQSNDQALPWTVELIDTSTDSGARLYVYASTLGPITVDYSLSVSCATV